MFEDTLIILYAGYAVRYLSRIQGIVACARPLDNMACVKLLLFISLAVLVTSQKPSPVVRVANGVLQGTWSQSTKGREYASFLGIPYARPPVGKYRFRVSIIPWFIYLLISILIINIKGLFVKKNLIVVHQF